MRTCGTVSLALLTVALATAVVPAAATAQSADLDAYFQGVADHFDLPTTEVRVLAEWQIDAEEVPLVLFLARRGGISPDALIAMERGGRSWVDLAQRYDVGAGAFHVPLDGSAGPLAGIYERYRSTPSSGWDEIPLQEGDMIQLVNLRVLSEYLRVSPRSALDARERTGSWVAAYRMLVRGG